MELRKIQETTDGTYFITVPKRWIKKVKLNKGSLVQVREHNTRNLILSPYSEPEREIASTILEPNPMIERLISENYLLGADIIEVRSSKIIPLDMRNKIKSIIKRFVGLEIVEEDSKKILIQCIIESSILIPEKVLRRIHLISLEMEKDAVASLVSGDKELAKTVIERDDEVDRLYFLIVRLVRAALTQPNLGDKLSVSPIQCLDYRLLASLIEHFADYASSIGDTAISNLIYESNDLKEKFKTIGDSVYNMYKDSFTSFFRKDILIAESILKRFHKLKEELSKVEEYILDLGKKERERLTSVVIALNYMCSICIDVSDLARSR